MFGQADSHAKLDAVGGGGKIFARTLRQKNVSEIFKVHKVNFRKGFAPHFHDLRVRLFLLLYSSLPRIYRLGYDVDTVYKLTLN